MPTLQTMLTRNDYKISLATLSVDGLQGVLYIKQNAAQARTDTASVIVKLEGEKEVKQKINTMVEWEGLKAYLSEYYVNAHYVEEWMM